MTSKCTSQENIRAQPILDLELESSTFSFFSTLRSIFNPKKMFCYRVGKIITLKKPPTLSEKKTKKYRVNKTKQHRKEIKMKRNGTNAMILFSFLFKCSHFHSTSSLPVGHHSHPSETSLLYLAPWLISRAVVAISLSLLHHS